MRPILAWLVFALAVAVPTAPLVYLSARAASAEATRARAELEEQRAATAKALEREIQLALLRAGAVLGEIDSNATLEEADGALRSASHPFADAFVLGAHRELLIPARGGPLDVPGANGEPSRRAVIEATLGGPAIMSFLRQGNAAEPFKQRVMRGNGWMVTVRRLASGLEVGWLVDEVSVVRGAATILPERLVLEHREWNDAAWVKAMAMSAIMKNSGSASFVMDVKSTRSGPLRSALGFDAPSHASAPGTEILLGPNLAFAVVPRDAAKEERDIRWRERRIVLLSGGGIALMIALAATLFWRARRAQRLADLRTDFVAAVSHELRTPLASVRMLAELLEAGAVPTSERQEVEQALAGEARRLHGTLDRMLRFGALARGKLVVAKTPVLVRSLVDDAARRLSTNHGGQEVIVDVDPSLEAPLDAGLVGLALDNLLGNAAKYAAGSGPITVRARLVDQTNVAIDVIDRGPGLDERVKKRIFLPFERADDRLSRATEGTGVGLALVRGIARAHGGDATVESRLGEGATFTLRFPRS